MSAREQVIPPPQGCPLSFAAERFKDKVAVDGAPGPLTYADLDARVGAASRSLVDEGLTPGDRVAVLAPNGIEAIISIFAVVRAGGLAIPLSTRLPADAVRDTLRALGTRLALYAPGSVLDVSREYSQGLRRLPLSDLLTEFRARGRVSGAELDPFLPAIGVSTSGSTGEPKVAALTLANLHYSAVGSNRNIAVDETDRWLLSLPLYHVGGLGIVFRCLLGGATVILPHTTSEAMSDSFLSHHRVTHVSVVPTQMRRMQSNSVRLDRFKAILAGGDFVPADLRESFRRAGARLSVSYGLTEMSSQVSTTSTDLGRHATDSGCVLPFRSVRIGVGGHLLVRGETLFAGYIDGEGFRRPVDSDGWFSTGDVGRFTREGYLLVEGRSDNMFVSGGENVQPEEIERALMSLPQVVRAVVVDVPDPEFGARPVAFVDFVGPVLSLSDLSDLLGARLPRFKHPVRILRFPVGPDTSLGKSDRKALRKIARGGSSAHELRDAF